MYLEHERRLNDDRCLLRPGQTQNTTPSESKQDFSAAKQRQQQQQQGGSYAAI